MPVILPAPEGFVELRSAGKCGYIEEHFEIKQLYFIVPCLFSVLDKIL